MNDVLIIGAGSISKDYVSVLDDLNIDFTVVGRSDLNAINFKKDTGVDVISGGIEKYLSDNEVRFSHAIVAVGIEKLFEVTKLLIINNIKNILVEKPGSICLEHLKELDALAKKHSSNVIIGYNRRFYSSTIATQNIIIEDGGVKSFNFEFTEWSHLIKGLDKPKGVLDSWFLGNSSHVVDLAFYLGGAPKDISCYTSGSLTWHESASIFCGAGVSETGALFSYQANWGAPGRWSVEILTNQHRLILRPMEKLQLQNIGSIDTEFVDIEDEIDKDFKPGIHRQVCNFLDNELVNFCDLCEQIQNFQTYKKIANY